MARPRNLRLLRNTRLLAAALALALALTACGADAARRSSHPPPFQHFAGSFYAVSAKLPARPGVLLRYRPFTTGLPPGGKAWLILYTTRRANGSIGLASGIVLTPSGAGSSPLPVIAYAHGTSGIAQGCAPSVVPGGEGPFYSGIPAVQQVVKQGWAIVAPDYTGLGAAGPVSYLIGPEEARSVLDSVRAARELPVVSLSKRTVVWGYSQGGQAALWTGALAPSYAADVKLSGVAAMAPATEPAVFLDRAERNPTVEAFSAYTLGAFAATYPDVHMENYVRAGALATVRAVASKCLGGPEPAPKYVESLPGEPWPFTAPLTSGALGRRLGQNVPTRHIGVPVFVAQGLSDEFVLPEVQVRWVAQRCAAGQSMEYRTYPGRTHTTLDDEDSALIGDLFPWTAQRLEGRPQAPGCRTTVG
ncbi:MAG TPA: lipase family protein [Solirubrobacteraceae bacterium]|nr:lipase family protein [Solirubrobacteraceae bacterium]